MNDKARRTGARGAEAPGEASVERHTPLGPGAEFDAIRRMIERWGSIARGVGDDAAVIATTSGLALVASTDVSVENVHFSRDWLNAEQIGYRAAASALSDLAAMGAQPLGMLVAMALPEDWRSSLDVIGDGIGIAARECDSPVLGGDMSRGEALSIAVTVLGECREPLLRLAACPGDIVYLTGTVGGAGAALHALQQGREALPEHLARFVHPSPRIREAAWLAGRGAHAAVDISDGLSSDLRHIAAASRVRIFVDLDSIPCARGVQPVDAASSGEEYEVVVTAPASIDEKEFQRTFGIPLTRIGTVETGEAGVHFLRDGRRIEVPRGYLHFG